MLLGQRGNDAHLEGDKMGQRDDKGRFVKGHSGGPGRPPKSREERFLEITLSSVTFDDWKAIIKKAVTQAKNGSKDARRFLAEYLLGKPEQKHRVQADIKQAIELLWPESGDDADSNA